MRVRAFYVDVEHLAREYVRRSAAPAYNARPRAVDTGVGSLRATKSEFHDFFTCRRAHYARRLCGNESLVVYYIQYRRFDELRFYHRCAHHKSRLLRKYDFALYYGINISGETKRTKIIEKSFVELPERTKIIYVVTRKPKILYVVYGLSKSRAYSIIHLSLLSEKDVEHRRVFICSVYEIPVHHRELV